MMSTVRGLSFGVSVMFFGGLSCGDTLPSVGARTGDAGGVTPVRTVADGGESVDAGVRAAADAGTRTAVDAGAVIMGDAGTDVVSYQGGSVGLVKFTAFGDIRPAIFEFDNNYPDDIVRDIATQMNLTAAQFALGVGDYMFSVSTGSVNRQLDKLIAAEQPFKKPIFHAMGNHECWGPTSINCPNYNETPNVRQFMARLFTFSTRPWYDFTVQTSHGAAKFVLIAQNTWNDEQKQWLEATLARPTEYTFIVRHQPSSAMTTPGIADCDRIIAAHPYTLLLLGHDHRYEKTRPNEVITGNGGAPLDRGHFGFLYVEQLASGTVRITEYPKAADLSHFDEQWTINASGAEVP